MSGPPRIRDVRADMPNYAQYRGDRRSGAVTGIAVHHSATANPATGVAMENARAIFLHHVRTLGWSKGGYHYIVHPTGVIEYALDEETPAFHAGFRDPDDSLALEHGQYWNNHLLAICLLGWFDHDRVGREGSTPIPNQFTAPTPGQWQALLDLLRDLMQRHGVAAHAVRGHRELTGCRTRCPGANVDLDALRAALAIPQTGDGR